MTLEIPIDARFELPWPLREGSDTRFTFSATVTFNESTLTALIGAGVGTIDIISMNLGVWVNGALRKAIATTFDDAPINNFDLSVDAGEDAAPGPHVLELDVTMPRGSSPSSKVRTTRGGVAARSTMLTLSERRLTTHASSSLRIATETGSRPTGTEASFAATPLETSKASKHPSGVLRTSRRLPSGDVATGVAGSDSNRV